MCWGKENFFNIYIYEKVKKIKGMQGRREVCMLWAVFPNELIQWGQLKSTYEANIAWNEPPHSIDPHE